MLIVTLIQKIAIKLLAGQFQLATAESCTGGLLAKVLTDQAGSSRWFERGFVTYSNASKHELLGVKISTLEQHGAISAAVACEMAAGVLSNSQAQFSIAITGIAGPGKTEKPVGTIWFAWAGEKFPTYAKMQQFSGDRALIRSQAVQFALQELNKLID
jgi:nicotinamide-nucleotide amidase